MDMHSPPSPSPDADGRALGNSFQIERYGLTWSGSWTLDDDKLVVTSTYGSRTVPIEGARDLDLAAQLVMGKIVLAWRQALPSNRDRRK